MPAKKQKAKPKAKPKQKQKQKNPLSSNELDLGLKPANEITEIDDLQFELGRLRTLMEMWDADIVVDGVSIHLLVDPMNRQVSAMSDTKWNQIKSEVEN